MIEEVELEAMRTKHGRIKHVVYNGVDLVFRKPSRTECKVHASKQDDPQQKLDADEQLAQVLILKCGESTDTTSARIAFNALLEEYGYMMKSREIVQALAQLTGVSQDESVKPSGIVTRPNAATPTNSRRV